MSCCESRVHLYKVNWSHLGDRQAFFVARSLKKLRQTALTCLLGLIYNPDCVTSSSTCKMIMNILSVLCRGLNYQALIFISYSWKLKPA